MGRKSAPLRSRLSPVVKHVILITREEVFLRSTVRRGSIVGATPSPRRRCSPAFGTRGTGSAARRATRRGERAAGSRAIEWLGTGGSCPAGAGLSKDGQTRGGCHIPPAR